MTEQLDLTDEEKAALIALLRRTPRPAKVSERPSRRPLI
jgi:hypothetical protein